MRCLIVNDEIEEVECSAVQAECYAKRPGKELEKKFKRVIGWNAICKTCPYHEDPTKKKKRK